MIRVELRPEPPTFDKQVRQPGLLKLATLAPDAKLPDYWRKYLDDLWREYKGVCAYMCTFIHRVTGASTVEHLAPKSKARDQAYEWSNYRLVCSTLNGRKSAFEDVLDPVEIDDGWFVLEFPGCAVAPAKGLAASRKAKVNATIVRLKLNDAKCVDERLRYWDDYIQGHTSFAFLTKYAPFIAKELARQGLTMPGR